MGTGWLISSPGISLSAGHQWSLLVALLLWGLPLLLFPAGQKASSNRLCTKETRKRFRGVYMPELQSTSSSN